MTAVHYAVLTHDRPQSLAALLASIAAQEYLCRPAITIFDNGSNLDNAHEVRSVAHEHGASLIRSEINLRMAGRRALEDRIFESRIAADVLVHLDDDVVLSRGWLGAALAGLAGNEVGACGSIEDRDGDLMISGQRTVEIDKLSTTSGEFRAWRWTWQSPKRHTRAERVEFAGHRALAVRADAASRVRHDPDLIAGGDDIDYSLALRHAGYELRVATDALILHRSLGESEIAGFRTRDAVVESWSRFHRRWGFVRDTAAAEAGLSLTDFLALVTQPEEPASERLGDYVGRVTR